MPFVFGVRSRQRLTGLHPELVRVVTRALELSAVDFSVLEGLRTVERQRELVAAGASQTMASRHLSGHAVDLGAWVGGTIRWDGALYLQIADAVQQASRQSQIPVRWGGAWSRLDGTHMTPAQLQTEYVAGRRAVGKPAFIDGPHFELPREVFP